MHCGVAVLARGDDARAAELLQACHAAQVDAHSSEEHPDVLETAWRLGSLLVTQSQRQRQRQRQRGGGATPAAQLAFATELLRSTAAKQAEVVGAQKPPTLRTRVSLAEALLLTAVTADAKEARKLLAGCQAGLSAVLNPTHPDLEKTRALLAAATAAAAADGR